MPRVKGSINCKCEKVDVKLVAPDTRARVEDGDVSGQTWSSLIATSGPRLIWLMPEALREVAVKVIQGARTAP